jgi:hypothetical protein
MSAVRRRVQQRVADFLVFAYKTFALYFLFISVLLFSIHSGGWINYFIVFLMLSSAFALVPAFRLLRRLIAP